MWSFSEKKLAAEYMRDRREDIREVEGEDAAVEESVEIVLELKKQ
jgi:hypothetical protein